MAQGISLISGSPLIGNPIVFRVSPAAYSANRTFHRIIVRVYAGLETDEDFTTFDFSHPAEVKQNGQSYVTQPSLFDISSALQAIAEKYEYTPEPPEHYPYIKFRIEAWDEWMVDGNVSSNQGVVAWPSLPVGDDHFYCYAFQGAFNDIERMTAPVDQSGMEYLDVTYLSRKPNTSPEIVFKDIEFVYPSAINRGMEVDHMSDDANPVFVSAEPTYDTEVNTAYRYDNIPGQSTGMATDGAIVLLVYNNIETDNALKICHVEPTIINPITGIPSGGGITWTSYKANLDDAYLSQYDGKVYIATLTGWEEGLAASDGPKSVSQTLSEEGAMTVGGHEIYVVERPTNGYDLRFVNSMGCLESVCVTSLVKKEVDINTESYTIARQETLKKFSRVLAVKSENHETWSLASGPLDEAWASWYIHEFLMAKLMWIGIIKNSQTIWVPCHVLPEETTMLIDKVKASMMSIEFKVQLDIYGPSL